MPSLEHDLGYLDISLGILEEYLLSKDVYWQLRGNPPAGEPPYPSLTLGGILLAQARANARRLSSSQEARLYRINQQIESIRTKWRVAWEKKAGQEFSARLNLWRDYLEEYRQNPETNADRYPYEVGRRVMLELLNREAGELRDVDREMLSGLDSLLNAVLQKDGFVWEEELTGGFPEGQYPYLYGKLRI